MAVFAALSFGPATGGLAAENAAEVRRAGAHAPARRAWATRCSRRSRAGTRLVPAHRRTRATRDSEVRAAFFPLYPPAGARSRRARRRLRGALLIAAYLVLAGGLPRRRSCCSTGWWRSSSGASWPPLHAAAARGLPGGALLRGALLGEPLPARARWAPSTRPGRGAGRGPAPARPRRRPPAARASCCCCRWRCSGGARSRAGPATAAWLLLAPLGLAAYALFLGLGEGDALRFLDVQDAWSREFAGPFVGAWDGLVRGRGRRAPARSRATRTPVYFERGGRRPVPGRRPSTSCCSASSPSRSWPSIGVWRRLPRPYGAYVVAALVLPLSFPVGPAAADVAATLPRGAVPDLHVARPRLRGAARAPTRWSPLSRRSASACSPRSSPAGTSSHEPARGPARRARHARASSSRPHRACDGCWPRPASRWTRSARAPASGPRSPTTWSITSRAPIRVSLDDLRDRCADALREALALPGLDHATARGVMLAALEFTALPRRRAGPATSCGTPGRVLVVVSNWDCSLPEWLRPTGPARPGGRRGVVGGRGRRQARSGAVPARARAGRRRAGARRCTWATRPRTTWRARAAAGVRAVLVDRGGRTPPECRHGARRSPSSPP